jgi:ornithine cyclodeaminase/alanine dehydrogenase-like protein (mu-crystallin family)
MPAKISVHPRSGCVLEAMPCWHKPADVVGMKWIADFATNRARGLPSVHAIVVLNDAEMGVPTWILDASTLTAVRTAAVSGVVVQALAPPTARTAAILGAGTQSRSHLSMLGFVVPGVRVSVYSPNPTSTMTFARWAERERGIAAVDVAPSARDAVGDAQIVITAAALGSVRQVMQADWVQRDCLVVALDDDTYVSADLARSAERFIVDDRSHFLAQRGTGAFTQYPDPTGIVSDFVDHAPTAAELAEGRTLFTSIGTAVVDVLFAEEVRRLAERRGMGHALEA